MSQVISSIINFLSRKSSIHDITEIFYNFKILTKDGAIMIVSILQTELVMSMKKVIYNTLIENSENFPYKDSDIEEVLANMKLIRIKNNTELKDLKFLHEYDLKNREEFLLKFSRPLQSPVNEKLSGPTEGMIVSKTINLPNLKSCPIFDTKYLFYQDDLRKLFITLAKESAYILCAKTHSIKVLTYYRQKIQNYMKNQENAFKVMYKLGFSEDNVKEAMRLNANNYELALDWLIDNVIQHENLRLSKSPRPSLISNKRTSILSASFDPTSALILDRLHGLLGVVEFYSEMDELVYETNIDKMVNMGYENEEAREALRIVKNNIGAACEFLNGQESGSVIELRVGLDKSSVIYDFLMKMPATHRLLSFTESFIYFNKILEEHVIEWDPQTNNGKLMREVIYSYHDQKQSLVANQFNNSTIPISALSAPLT